VKNIIPYVRRQKGIKQNEMAKALHVSPSYICKVERGLQEPTTTFMNNCAAYLGTRKELLFPEKIEISHIYQTNESCANKLWNVRRKRGIKQNELAKKLACSPSYLSKVEKGLKKPTSSFKKNCAKILKIKETELFSASL
jgi:putative transcriptional regulator